MSGRWTGVVLVTLLSWSVLGCGRSDGFPIQSDFADDPIVNLAIEGTKLESLLAAPIGGPTAATTGFQSSRNWHEMSPEGFKLLLSSVADNGVTFHGASCFDRGPSFDGAKRLQSGLLASVVVLYDPRERVGRVTITGWPEGSANVFSPPSESEITGDCDPEWLTLTGLS